MKYRAVVAAALFGMLPAEAPAEPPDQSSSLDAAVALRPYYARLSQTLDLPRAPKGRELAPLTEIRRIALGSCDRQDKPQAFWDTIDATDPQLFLMICDNVYGDPRWTGDAELSTLRAAYAQLAQAPQFQAFRERVPMLAVWDDHDFGFNDGGAAFAFREWSETVFETFWNSSDAVRARPGVYEAHTFGKPGRRLQIIMLDTRFFRSPLQWPDSDASATMPGRYVPDPSSEATMLGQAQWRWLEDQLRQPADLRLVVSSVQVLSEAHRWEGWGLFPRERERLLAALVRRSGGGLVLLSGDRHAAGLYHLDDVREPAGFHELTSSSLNAPGSSDMAAREPDPRRNGPLFDQENFATLDIDWPTRSVTLSIRDEEGEGLAEETVRWDAR
jgi:alkaline phosphatase D